MVDRGPKPRPIADRFWSKVRQGNGLPPDGWCWIWTGAKDRLGYGRFAGFSRKPTAAYRVAYEMMVAKIPSGYEIDHGCRVPSCVNPSHLQVVTHKTNMARAIGTPQDLRRRQTHCVNGHPFSGNNLYFRTKGGRLCKQCGLDYKKRARVRDKALKLGGKLDLEYR